MSQVQQKRDAKKRVCTLLRHGKNISAPPGIAAKGNPPQQIHHFSTRDLSVDF
jgi:hypothetical protein